MIDAIIEILMQETLKERKFMDCDCQQTNTITDKKVLNQENVHDW